MPSDALEQPSDEAPEGAALDRIPSSHEERPVEAASLTRNRPPQLESPPGKPALEAASPPEGVVDQVAHPSVDLAALDPALVEDGRRLCVAATKAGERCSAPAITSLLLCSFHSGRLDPAQGGKARAQKLRLVAEEAQNREITARLGTRAIVAAALAEKHEEIRLAIHELADRAADGDRQCALALLPYMTQALGTPAQAGPATLQVEGEDIDLSTLDTASLRALLRTTPTPE